MANGNIEIVKLIDWHKLSRREQKAQKNNNPYKNIPNCAGVYKIYIEDKDKLFIKFGSIVMVKNILSKKANPRLPSTLDTIYNDNISFEQNDEKHVIYIGKADVSKTKPKYQDGLKRRIKQHVRTVFGGNKHNGGVDIWAVQNYEKYLHVEWFEREPQFSTAEDMESHEIDCFKQRHKDNLPLANRKNGKKRR